MEQFELLLDAEKQWRWRYVDGFGNVVAVSFAGYPDVGACKFDLMIAIATDIHTPAVDAEVLAGEGLFARTLRKEPHFAIKRLRNGLFGWKLRHSDGRVIAVSGEPKATYRSCTSTIDRVKAATAEIPIRRYLAAA